MYCTSALTWYTLKYWKPGLRSPLLILILSVLRARPRDMFEEKRLRSASVWVIGALRNAAVAGPLSPRTRRRALKKQRKTVSSLWSGDTYKYSAYGWELEDKNLFLKYQALCVSG